MINIRTNHAIDHEIGFVINEDGSIVRSNVTEEFGRIPVSFDTAEYLAVYKQLPSVIDILDIGYTLTDGYYEPPAAECRQAAVLGYEQVCALLQNRSITWYPGLLAHLVRTCLAKNVFVDDGLVKFVNKVVTEAQSKPTG